MSTKALSTLAVYALHLADSLELYALLSIYTYMSTPKPGLVSPLATFDCIPPPWLGFKQEKTEGAVNYCQ